MEKKTGYGLDATAFDLDMLNRGQAILGLGPYQSRITARTDLDLQAFRLIGAFCHTYELDVFAEPQWHRQFLELDCIHLGTALAVYPISA